MNAEPAVRPCERNRATYYSHPEVDLIVQKIFPDPSSQQSVQVVLKQIVQKEHLKAMRRCADDYVQPLTVREHCWINHEFYAHILTRQSYKVMMDLLVHYGVLHESYFTSMKGRHPTYCISNSNWLRDYQMLPVTIPRVLKKISTYQQFRLSHYPAIEQVVIPHIINNFCFIDLNRQEFDRLWERRYIDRYLKFPRKYYLSLEQYRQHGEVVWRSIEAWNHSNTEQKVQWFNVCSFGHRLHHPFTYWPKEIRAYVLDAHGNPLTLVEFDLANSQIFIFANMLVQQNYKLRQETFVKLVERRKIYEDVAMRLGIERDPAKTIMLHWLYSMATSHAQVEFEKHYGQVALIAKAMKLKEYDADGNRLKFRNRHKQLPKMMQRAESAMFRDIWPQIIEAGYVMLPVHDAVYVANVIKKTSRIPIKRIMRNTVKKHMKLRFKIKDEEVQKMVR